MQTCSVSVRECSTAAMRTEMQVVGRYDDKKNPRRNCFDRYTVMLTVGGPEI